MTFPVQRHRQAAATPPNLAHTASNEPLHSLGFTKSHKVRTGIALVLVFILVYGATIASAIWLDTAHAINTAGRHFYVQTPKGKTVEPGPIDPNSGKPITIAFLAQDTRSGAANMSIGGGGADAAGDHNTDTIMIVQIAADRSSYINAVSIPRDSIVNSAACTIAGKTMAARRRVMVNSIFAAAFNYFSGVPGVDPDAAGASCAVQTLTALTGLPIDGYVLADFAGSQAMIDAVGGVDICIPQPILDYYTGLKLTAGLQHLDGLTASQYARVRHGVGDGSDIGRTVRQQYLVKTLIQKVLSLNFFSNSDKLYQFMKKTLNSLRMSDNLAQIGTLTGLAYSLRNFKTTNFYSRTVPIQAYPADPNRVEWAPGADDLWKVMKENKPLFQNTTPSSDKGSTGSSGTGSTGGGQSTDGSQSGSTGGTGGQPASGGANTSDPKTGLITQADGTLTDPKTGGRVDPKTGLITDPVTGNVIGMADQYLMATVCAVPAQK